MSGNRIAEIASLFAGWVKETGGANRGRWVEALQRIGNGQQGDPWCAHFVTAVLDIAYRGASPLSPTGSCDIMLADARRVGRDLVTPRQPKPGDVFFVMRSLGSNKWHTTDAIHVGVITGSFRCPDGVLRIATVEGNTNDDGGREGHSCLARTRALTRALAVVRLPEAL
jgi:hypothetical protein